MITILDRFTIELEAENFADKLFIHHFATSCFEHKLHKNITVFFKNSFGGGGGECGADNLEILEADDIDDNRIDVDDITGMEIKTYNR